MRLAPAAVALAAGLAAAPAWAHVSSSLVRQIHALGGPIAAFVPSAVLMHLERRG